MAQRVSGPDLGMTITHPLTRRAVFTRIQTYDWSEYALTVTHNRDGLIVVRKYENAEDALTAVEYAREVVFSMRDDKGHPFSGFLEQTIHPMLHDLIHERHGEEFVPFPKRTVTNSVLGRSNSWIHISAQDKPFSFQAHARNRLGFDIWSRVGVDTIIKRIDQHVGDVYIVGYHLSALLNVPGTSEAVSFENWAEPIIHSRPKDTV